MKEKSALRGKMGLERENRDHAHGVLAHQRHRLGLEHAPPVEFAAVQEHAQKAPIVGKTAATDRRRDRERWLRRMCWRK